ncbi:MAG: RICIN domain-containing protein [Streptomyces turgidiscabies]|nr:RICIN domain-containing protein [Streptomyces turgidiscabies]
MGISPLLAALVLTGVSATTASAASPTEVTEVTEVTDFAATPGIRGCTSTCPTALRHTRRCWWRRHPLRLHHRAGTVRGGLYGSGGTGGTTTGPLRAIGSGTCLDVPGASQTNGTQTQIWDRHGGTDPQWHLG